MTVESVYILILSKNKNSDHKQMTTKQREFSKAFIQETVALLKQGVKPPAYIAWKRGVPLDLLYQWLEQVDSQAKEDDSLRSPAPKVSRETETGASSI